MKIENLILAFVIISAMYPVWSPFAGRLDGRLFPVVGNVVFEQIEASEGGSIVSGHYSKFRNCDFVSSKWYRYPAAEVEVKRLAEVQIHHPHGKLPSGPLFIHASPDTVSNEMYSVSHHRCYVVVPTTGWRVYFPWTTRTIGWNGVQ